MLHPEYYTCDNCEETIEEPWTLVMPDHDEEYCEECFRRIERAIEVEKRRMKNMRSV